MAPGLVPDRELFPSLGSYLRDVHRFAGGNEELAQHPPEEIWAHWIGLWKRRIRERWDNVIQVTGPARCGKSTLALKLGRDLDPSIDASSIGAHMASTPDEVLQLYRTLRPGQVGIYDEAIRGQQSTEFSSADSRMLVQLFNTAGVRRITLFLLIPHRLDLNASTRDRRVDFWIKCSRSPRGRGYVHKRADDWGYERAKWAGLSLIREWSPLEWSDLNRTALWRSYEREKLARLEQQTEEGMARVRAERAYVDDFKVREELEREIRKQLAAGKTRRQIHDELGVSPNTISRVSQKVQLERAKSAGSR